MSESLVTLGRLVLARPGLALLSGAAQSGGGGSGGAGGGNTPSGLSNIALAMHGQSNSNFFAFSDGAALLQAQCVSAWLGGTGTPATLALEAMCVGGTGVDCGVAGYGSYLTWNGDTVSDAQTAMLSSTGSAMIAAIEALTSGQKGATLGLCVDWGETDSLWAGTGYAGNGGFGYGDKAVYKAALLNDFAQIRAAFGKTAAQLPILIFGVTFGSSQGYAMVREAWAELAQNPANNLVWGLPQTGDDVTRGDNWSSATGLVTTGSPIAGHVDNTTNLIFAQRSSLAFARIIAASQGVSGCVSSVFGAGLGPKIVAANLSGNVVTCTVQHDAGSDLIVPLLAAQGVGFSVMDGGTAAEPAAQIQATACVRVDATHIAVTLASAPVNPAADCTLFYPLGANNSAQPLQPIGRGCAVTDNFSAVLGAQGISLPSVTGAVWSGNYPIQSPMQITGSGSGASATFGISLS
jgi:hypothetical protein